MCLFPIHFMDVSIYAVHTLAQDRVCNHAEAFVHTQSRSSSVSALPLTSRMYSTRTHNGDGPDLEAAKKATLCFDCGQAGHWAGDDECTSPKKEDSRHRREQGGKGLGKRKGTFRRKKKTNKKKQPKKQTGPSPSPGRGESTSATTEPKHCDY